MFFCPFHDLLSLFCLSFTSNIHEIIESEKKKKKKKFTWHCKWRLSLTLFFCCILSFHCYFQSWEVHSYRRPGIFFIFLNGQYLPFRYLLCGSTGPGKKKVSHDDRIYFHPEIPRFVPVRILSEHTHEKKEKKGQAESALFPQKKRIKGRIRPCFDTIFCARESPRQHFHSSSFRRLWLTTVSAGNFHVFFLLFCCLYCPMYLLCTVFFSLVLHSM